MRLARLIASLPATVPFVAPEALERASGHPFELRLGANESPFGPSPSAATAMAGAARDPSWYGDPESWTLREALSARHRRPANEIAVGSGIDDLLGLLVRAVIDPGDVAVASEGSYPTFAYHVAGFGGRMERVPYFGFANDLDALLDTARLHDAKVVYLANPDNPTGAWLSFDEIERFARRLPGGCLLVLDEAYAEFCPEALPNPPPDRCVRLRTFSKAYGMAGARIGFAMGPRWLIGALDRIRNHFGVNRIAQAGALASLGDDAHLQTVVAEVVRGRAETADVGESLGLRALPSGTNFIALLAGDAGQSASLVEALAERYVFVRRPGVPPLDAIVRVTIGTPPQRSRFAAVLGECV